MADQIDCFCEPADIIPICRVYIIPVEVKADENVKATSIKNYYKLYECETPIVVRLSLRNLSLDGNVLNVPLFLADKLDKLIEIALKTK